MLAIVDYGMGNVRSLANAFDYIGEDVVLTADPGALLDADRIILPGVGAFGDAMVAINAAGLRPVLDRIALELRRPVLAVCLGMQLFARSSSEHGRHEGLGWMDADVVPIVATPPAKVPHVGWNAIDFATDAWLFAGLPPGESDFYFVHSFQMICHDPADLIATTDHGGAIAAAVCRANLVATQFHPEKSQDNGLRLLQNWMEHDFAC